MSPTSDLEQRIRVLELLCRELERMLAQAEAQARKTSQDLGRVSGQGG